MGRDVSLALRDICEPLGRELQAKGDQFDQAVRRKRQEAGLPVSLAAKVLPLRLHQDAATLAVERRMVAEMEQHLAAQPLDLEVSLPRGTNARGHAATGEVSTTSARWRTWADLRAQSAELRMREAFAALEAVESSGWHSLHELERLEGNYQQAMQSYQAAMDMLHTVRCDRPGAPDISISVG
jgi:hypothetical protein